MLNIFQQDVEDINKGVSFFYFAKELGICECLEIGQPGEIMKGHKYKKYRNNYIILVTDFRICFTVVSIKITDRKERLMNFESISFFLVSPH